ncbi:heavy-metal-associated domain-containing protein [Urechidicola vernalis]|uniref:Heavy metal-associated domain-containing protein n=1 Tax=Urechidicola vernalis TaxID=3075600 RepID=A0ABU2Y705_9FLAO|nr:heavy metal-associated domain-containing protein [Urechidicola sp. P050]MDT0553985.1 heavy metal-associated domain-containing protein [Urechidicola sp. P050]
MKLLRIYIFAFISIIIFACNTQTTSNKKVDKSNSENRVAKIENVEVTIEGMTCEIGCAKLIESKTHKLEGIIYANVSFEQGLGQFTVNTNKISIEDIEKHINGIAGGELYKVTSTSVVDEFTLIEEIKEETE